MSKKKIFTILLVALGLDLLVPDPVPFIDEIILIVASLVYGLEVLLGKWKKKY